MSRSSRRTRGTARPAGSPSEPARATTDAARARDGARAGAERVGGTRVGRRERPRTGYARRSAWERYRALIVALAVIAAVGVIGAFAFSAATTPAYACSNIWEPSPTPSPAAGASPDLGYVQPDMGRQHGVSQPQRYTYCPPASGNHQNRQGVGPIAYGYYGPDDVTEPGGWIHNLEHGSLVVLYRGREGDPGFAPDAQAQLRDLIRTLPPSPVCNRAPGSSIVVTRFDDMAWPYAALLWGRVLPLETLDVGLIEQYWQTKGERTNPEPQCVPPSPSPSAPASSPAAPGSPEPTGSAPAASPASS